MLSDLHEVSIASLPAPWEHAVRTARGSEQRWSIRPRARRIVVVVPLWVAELDSLVSASCLAVRVVAAEVDVVMDFGLHGMTLRGR